MCTLYNEYFHCFSAQSDSTLQLKPLYPSKVSSKPPDSFGKNSNLPRRTQELLVYRASVD